VHRSRITAAQHVAALPFVRDPDSEAGHQGVHYVVTLAGDGRFERFDHTIVEGALHPLWPIVTRERRLPVNYRLPPGHLANMLPGHFGTTKFVSNAVAQ
jgi:hypothetical protein